MDSFSVFAWNFDYFETDFYFSVEIGVLFNAIFNSYIEVRIL
jgi:hypothetical protein